MQIPDARGGGGGEEGYCHEFRTGVCREESQTLTLFNDKENEIDTLFKAQTPKMTRFSRGGEASRDDPNKG